MRQFESMHRGDYITADIESPLAKVKMDIHDIPFPENTFDVVLCNHVLEHVNNDIKAMSEIRRVLKPGGYSIMQVPFFRPVPDATIEDTSIVDAREREKAFGQDDHVRKYGKDYPERIEKAGLKATASPFASELPRWQTDRYGLADGEVLYLGGK